MAKLTIGQKAERVLALLMGLGNAKVASALGAHGFAVADLEEGWQRARRLARQAPCSRDREARRRSA